MKNLLLYNYNIDIDEYENIKDGITFYIDYDKYYFISCKRVSSDIEKIYNLLKNYINPYHLIIVNRFGNIYTIEDGKTYVLLKIKGAQNDEIELREIMLNQTPIHNFDSILKRDNWGILWSEKVDYLEYQVSELAQNHPIVLSSFSYYVGLAENAIEYYNMLEHEDIDLVISQKRIKYPNFSLNYFNPLNIVIDSKTRDIAEYIKSAFFAGYDATKDLENLCLKNTLSGYEYNLLYARLLYPSYYFDELSKVLEENSNEEVLLKYIDKVDVYEKFLKNIFYMFSKKTTMIKVDWLIKKED